jgi:hypothetical protein
VVVVLAVLAVVLLQVGVRVVVMAVVVRQSATLVQAVVAVPGIKRHARHGG